MDVTAVCGNQPGYIGHSAMYSLKKEPREFRGSGDCESNCCLLVGDAVRSDSLLPKFWRNLLFNRQERSVYLEDRFHRNIDKGLPD
jgi:hypothetical protein